MRNFEPGDIWQHESGLRYRVEKVEYDLGHRTYYVVLERVSDVANQRRKHTRDADQNVGWTLVVDGEFDKKCAEAQYKFNEYGY